MEEYILRAKHWQIFITLLIPTMLYSVVPDFSTTIWQVKRILIVIAFYSWLYLVGKGLNICIPRRHTLDHVFMTFNFFFLSIGFTILNLLLDPGVRVNFTGWAFLVFLYFIFSFFYMFYFASKALTSAEKGRRTRFGEHIGEMLLFMTGILGIWILQPRINKIYDANKGKFEYDEQ